ncbi:MAG: cob(I)yrinic acid a,c-diamide adenosyltransferase [Bacteroidales bacterium]|nr:cob(I)yrinic acid a,c-diamide adenosyltransferase [Bacteroidales bacterium]
MKGFVHVYTGNGKGKTTAAFGLALRASGAGLKVFIGQFIKGQLYHEIQAVNKFIKNITVKQYGIDCFIINEPTEKDKAAAQKGLEDMKNIIASREYNMVIMDEVNMALYYGLIDIGALLDIIDNRPKNIELILTGRYAPHALIEKADLVTEMTEIKHYYRVGVEARKGIEF